MTDKILDWLFTLMLTGTALFMLVFLVVIIIWAIGEVL